MPAGRFALVLLAVAVAPLSFAQERKKPEKQDFEGKGVVAGLQGGVVQMLIKREHEGKSWEEPWLGRLVPGAKVDITGFAEREVLRPGMFVRFSAEFDMKSGAALAPVSELEIVSPRPLDTRGIIPDEVIDPAEKRKKGPPPATAKLRFFEQITGVKDGAVHIKKYRIELAPDAVINVDVTDPSVLSRGDQIGKVKGWYIKGTRGALFIEEMDVTLTKPLAVRRRVAPGAAAAKGPGGKNDVFNVAGDEASGKKSEEKADDAKKDEGKAEETKKEGGKKNGAKKVAGKQDVKKDAVADDR
jgi:hypothetical protein